MTQDSHPGENLLTAWLGPPEPAHDPIVRERLHDRLRNGTQGALTLVSAPAGSGKTALVGRWVRSGAAPGPVVWVTMEVGEDGRTLWPVLMLGLERAGIDVSDLSGTLGTTTSPRPVLLALARRIATHETPVVLVLEEAGCLRQQAPGRDLDFLLGHCRNNLRLVVVARADPALPLHRYRLEGSVTEVRADDLRFTEAEAAALFGSWGLTLSGTQLREALRRTSGWAAGLRFLAIELDRRSDVDEAIREFVGGDGEVAGYLMAEVLDAQPPELRDVLMRSSVLRRLTPALVSAMTGRLDGQRVLDVLRRSDVPIERAEGPGAGYQFPPLFRDFLLSQLAYERPDLVVELEATAATAEAVAPLADPVRAPLMILEPLTKKEQEVLGHLADLLTTTEIAEAMYVSVNTVRTHIRNVLRKLQVSRRNEAVRTAWERGLITPRSPARPVGAGRS